MSIGTQGWLDGAATTVSHVRVVLIFLLSTVLSIVGEAPGAATGPTMLLTASLLRRMECALWMHDNGPALTLLPGTSTLPTVRRAVPLIDLQRSRDDQGWRPKDGGHECRRWEGGWGKGGWQRGLQHARQWREETKFLDNERAGGRQEAGAQNRQTLAEIDRRGGWRECKYTPLRGGFQAGLPQHKEDPSMGFDDQVSYGEDVSHGDQENSRIEGDDRHIDGASADLGGEDNDAACNSEGGHRNSESLSAGSAPELKEGRTDEESRVAKDGEHEIKVIDFDPSSDAAEKKEEEWLETLDQLVQKDDAQGLTPLSCYHCQKYVSCLKRESAHYGICFVAEEQMYPSNPAVL